MLPDEQYLLHLDVSPLQIYGKEQLFDAERVVDLLQALETFSVASTSAQGSLLPPAGASAATRCALLLTRCGSRCMPELLSVPRYALQLCLLAVLPSGS